MVDFCYAYLGLPTTVETLYTIFRQYKSRLDKQQQSHKITAPITSDGQEIAFYVVQALPYHLQSFQPGDSSNSLRFFFEKSTSSSSMLWAKIYWGMSNPMSRTPDPPNSPLSVLFGLGLLSQEAMKEKDEALQAEHVVAAVANGRGNEVAMFFEQRSSMLSVYMDVLVVAVQANDEHNARKALDAAKSVPPNSEWDPTTPTWPDHVIWAATWLNMANLVETLIGNRVDPNHGEARDTSTGSAIRFFPSLIYMASRLGHASIVKKLLDRNANANILIEGASGSFQTAANGGHTEVLRVFVAHDRSHLRSRLPDTALFSASAWGNWRSVVELLELGSHPDDAPDPSDDDPPRWTPLAAACSKAAPRTVETLLNYKANPNIIGANGVATPLWFSAVNVPNDECVRAMLRHGANPNHEQFKQPLLNAVVCSSHKVDTIVSICNALLNGRQPINVNAFDSSGVTALMLAAELEELPVVRWLLNNGADVNMLDDQNRSAIYYAVSAGSTTAVEELLKFGPNLACLHTSVKQPILATAIRNPQILEILLRTGVDLDLADADGCTAINEASTQGVTDAVKLLIEKGADINHTDNQGWSPICDAVGYVHNPAMVRLLADHGAKLDVTMEDKSLLHLALGGPPDILKTLLEFRKALDINAKDKKKCTALHVAADCSYTEHLKILLRAGADVNARDIAEETPLHKAARDSNSDALSCLLREPDMEVNSIAPKEDSPLHIACRWLNFKGVRTLLCHGANVHVASANSFCSTPLMAALLSYHGPDHEDAATIDVIARTLVFHRASENAGANVQQEVHGSRFYTALSAACLGASVRTLNFLLEQGASAQVRDPVSGRFPHHFAAANGIDNFRSIMLSYNDDMMVSDKAGKNCIHWAAQFGNLNTILFILARLRDTGSQERVMQYINQPDSDGWTPLCWAARPWPNTLFEWTRSEKRDFAGVIRTLLENGANRTVQCALGNGWVIERPDILTPLELARWCKADDDVINLLRYGVEGESRPRDEESSQPVRRYVLHTITCDICLNRDDEEHRFALDSELREYRDPPLPFPLGGEKDIELWFDAQGQRLEAKPDQTGDLWNSEDLDGIEMDSDIIDMDWTA
ncbi:Ankyrin repeat protein [Lasiodiplodia theobromae]|uniref:Ankyrin repeat protein n=1 Tax=Lasiodiplodia theobromae TaxID=45133 RepID=UPI0015C2DAF4|nr:Ankyrin repeat protein [Lasiodiplodia theobromae]KAF4537795.1 Ankyrin repeat protein [Lasiodiplodia theobromae]